MLDRPARYRLAPRYELTLGVNNLTGARYFTKRTGEYPGPGILPGIGRSLYAGVRAVFRACHQRALTSPSMPGWIEQRYSNDPTVGKTRTTAALAVVGMLVGAPRLLVRPA